MTGLSFMAAMAACASGGSGYEAPTPDAARPADAAIPVDTGVNMCPSAATCATAIALGEISGDTNSPKLTAIGYQSAWYRVRVTEDYLGVEFGPSQEERVQALLYEARFLDQ